MKKSIELIEANKEWKTAIQTYQSTFDHPTHVPGASGLTRFLAIDDWFEKLKLYQNEATLPSPEFVPSVQYLLVEQTTKKVIGMLAIRLRLNEHLLNVGGHIGYSIAPNERQKGYGSMMLKLALIKAKCWGLSEILVTCDDENLASAQVIKNNSGVLEDKRLNEESQKWVRRYWILND